MHRRAYRNHGSWCSSCISAGWCVCVCACARIFVCAYAWVRVRACVDQTRRSGGSTASCCSSAHSKLRSKKLHQKAAAAAVDSELVNAMISPLRAAPLATGLAMDGAIRPRARCAVDALLAACEEGAAKKGRQRQAVRSLCALWKFQSSNSLQLAACKHRRAACKKGRIQHAASMVAAVQHMTRCTSTTVVLIAFFGPRNLLLGNAILSAFVNSLAQTTGRS
jgi:hypothetical protein